MRRIVPFLVLLLTACSTSPLGRKQLTALPDSQMNQMGVQSFEQLKKETPIEKDPAINAYVRCVAIPITRAAVDETGVSDWEIIVFKDSTANAFALPGGKIGVHTGLLTVAKTQNQLATVLGHEVGHVIARHGNERVSEALGLQLLSTAAAVTFKDKAYQPAILAGLGIGAQYGIVLPHSRGQESEADLIGLDLMATAGFDPRESVDLWKNMMVAAGGKSPPQFLSTHPSSENRIVSLQERIPQTLPKYESVRDAGHAPDCVKPHAK